MGVKSDAGYDHPHSAPVVLRFNCLQRGRIFRQVKCPICRIQTDLHVLFCCSLGGGGDDLDVLLIVHSGLVPALGVQGGYYSDSHGGCQGTVSPTIAICDRPLKSLIFFFRLRVV